MTAIPPTSPVSAESATVDLYWMPLGAGGRFVKCNGRAYEALTAKLAHRPAAALFHSALIVTGPEGPVVIEMTPAAGHPGRPRGVVAEGPVGARWAGRSILFRYELRRWPGGTVDDIDEAVGGPHRLSDDPAVAARLLALVPHVPLLTWGRDELSTGDMWNSNSVVSWLLTRAGLPTEGVGLPKGGRAPGWRAGLVAAPRAPAG